jgi:hypothetical protein
VIEAHWFLGRLPTCGLEVPVMVLGWNMNYEIYTSSGVRNKYIRTSQLRMDARSYPVWIDKIIDQGVQD